LVMQRNRERLDAFRLLLIRQSDEAFRRFDQLTGGRKCGPLFTDAPPISQSELNEARTSMLAETQQPFVAVREGVPSRVATTRSAIARDAAFRAILLAQYERRCAVSGIGLTTRLVAEGQAAHVVPLGRGGADEPRNGFILTRTLHWAFDRGLFGIDEKRLVVVPRSVQAIAANEWLVQFHGSPIGEANTESLRAAQEAFNWHRQNTMWQ